MSSAVVKDSIVVNPVAASIASDTWETHETSLMQMECARGAQRSFFRTTEFDSFCEKQFGPPTMESDWYDLMSEMRDTDDSASAATVSGKKEVRNTSPHHSKKRMCKLLQMPINRGNWQAKGKMRKLIVSDGSFRVQAQQCFCAFQMEQVLVGSFLGGAVALIERFWDFANWNDASKCGP